MESVFSIFTDVLESINVAVIHIIIGACGEFDRLMHSSTPLLDGCIKLIQLISVMSYIRNKL
jgi:hypothetical protein